MVRSHSLRSGNSDVYKNIKCLMLHQKHWQGVVTSVEPLTELLYCKKCGAWHVERSGLVMREDVERELDELSNQKERIFHDKKNLTYKTISRFDNRRAG